MFKFTEILCTRKKGVSLLVNHPVQAKVILWAAVISTATLIFYLPTINYLKKEELRSNN